MTLRIDAGSLVTIGTTISADVDLTGDVVQMAFTQNADPVEADWTTAAFVPAATGGRATLLAGCGRPGGDIELAIGAWDARARVTDNPEISVLRCGRLIIE